MSNPETEICKSDGDSQTPEIPKPNEGDSAELLSTTDTKTVECADANVTFNGQNAAPDTNEINTAEVKADTEISSEKPALNDAVAEENKEPTKNFESEQLKSIGGGEPCPVVDFKKDETLKSQVNSEVEKPDAEIAVSPAGDQIISKIDDVTASEIQNDKQPADDTTKADANELTMSRLKDTMLKTAEERNLYKKKFEMAETKLAALQKSFDSLMKGGGDEMMLRGMVEQLKSKLIQTSLQLEDRVRIVANQEKQISALNCQVASLKEVETLTRSLLQIRNMEIKHLQTEVDDMEVRINEERQRYNSMINKMDAAVRLNADLKKEYETQLCLFRDLRGKYEEKVTLLSEEKRNLENTAQNGTA